MIEIFGNVNLKAIILAAGQGIRLRPLTNNKPKCLVELFGNSLINHSINTFQKCGISDITIVTGYLSNLLKIPNVSYVKNENYASTNMVETLFCAREKLDDSVIISYGDIIFEQKILQKLIDAEDDMSVIIDLDWEKYWKLRFEDPLQDAESLITNAQNFIQNIGQKPRSLDEIQGQYIGLMKFQNYGLSKLKSFYDKSKNQSLEGVNPLNPNISFERSYMTDLLQGLINDENQIRAIPINNGWLELDSLNDYEIYQEMYANGTLSSFFSIS
jgi:choline kinase